MQLIKSIGRSNGMYGVHLARTIIHNMVSRPIYVIVVDTVRENICGVVRDEIR